MWASTLVSKLLTITAPLLVAMFVSLVMISGIWRYWRWSDDKKRRKSGLARDLLRPVGESCRQKIDDLTLNISTYLSFLMLLPIVAVAFFLLMARLEPRSSTGFLLVCVAPPFLLAFIVGGGKLLMSIRERQNWMLGLDGELATAEELNLLMLRGCRVFHDIPTDYGNIDHVVVSPSGVICVETKARQKPVDGNDKARVRIDYATGMMRFPDWPEKIPSDQAEMQARWLSQWLSERCSATIDVEPMIALPGWEVEQGIRTRKETLVINPHKAEQFFVNSRKAHSESQVARIATELTTLCRNMKRVKGDQVDVRPRALATT